MLVLERQRIRPEFLMGCATQNTRALLRELFPESRATIKGRTKDSLLENAHIDDIEVTPDSFKDAMWRLMDSTVTGSYHVMEMADTEFRQLDCSRILDNACAEINAIYGDSSIQTNQPLATRQRDGDNETVYEILYLGEAEAEYPHPEKDGDDMVIDGQLFKFKAYLVLHVPVISKIVIGSAHTAPYVITRPIHRSVTPKAEMDHIQEWLSIQLRCEVPPIIGINEGVMNLLQSGRLTPRTFTAVEEDGARATYGRAPGDQNENSLQVEQTLSTWNPQKGSYILEQIYPFSVDTARAIFSFGARINMEGAKYVIQTVLGART